MPLVGSSPGPVGVGVVLVSQRVDQSRVSELKNLVESLGCTPVFSLVQRRRGVDPRYVLGRGKAEELAKLVKENGVELVVFGNSLSPSQVFNLAGITGVEVIDRTQLILRLFAERAETRVAKLQVEYAQLRYMLPHAREMVRLAKREERPGFKGLGRYEVDKYVHDIHRRMVFLRRRIEKERRARGFRRGRHREKGYDLVAIAGYTNSGKTTLLNALTGSGKATDNAMFTTLRPTTRRLDVGKRKILLTDTVGFIDELPPVIIEAFHSTLEELVIADVILLMIDVSEPIHEMRRKLRVSHKILDETGAVGVPIITVLNKTDLVEDSRIIEKILDNVRDLAPNPTPISAKTGYNLDKLRKTILSLLPQQTSLITLPANHRETPTLLSKIYGEMEIEKASYTPERISLLVRGQPTRVNRVEKKVAKLDS